MSEKFPEKKPPKIMKIDRLQHGLGGSEIRFYKDSIGRASVFGDDTEGRGREEYEKDFKIMPDELSGKRVLNMGAGPSVKYEREVLRSLSPDSGTEFYSVSPDYAEGKHRAVVLEALSSEPVEIRKHIHLVAGVGQLANFKKDSFDIAFLLHVLEHTNQQELLFEAMCSAIKPGGKIYAGPIIGGDLIESVEKNNKVRFIQTREIRQYVKDLDGFSYLQILLFGYFEKRLAKK